MKDYILKTMKAGQKGLYLCELPTGYGKTFNVVQAIKSYIGEVDSEQKIIYLTTLNKNLPEEELLAAFNGDLEEYNRHVLRIRSNFDEVTEKLETLQVPEKFQTDTYSNLLILVEKYNRAVARGVQDPEYMKNIEERLNEADKKFRAEIAGQLKKSFHNKQARVTAIRTDNAWSWIGKLYPAVFTDDHQVLLMSISKFMKRNSCLVEPSYEFLKAGYLDGAIIFVDEFDATKATIQASIIEEALATSEEYLSLFRQILRGLDPRYLSRSMRVAYQRLEGSIRKQYTFEKILEEARNIEQKYAVNLSYKTAEDTVDRKQNFLLKDATYHTLFQNGKNFIRAAVNEDENRVDIFFEQSKAFYANRSKEKENNISVYALLREINRFLMHFRVFLFAWAANYVEEINSSRNPEDDELTMDNALSTILGKFGLSYAGQQLVMSGMRGVSLKRETKKILPDNSFYNQGVELFELEDQDAHHDETRLRLVAVPNTPEKILAYLSEKATFIGVSATAEIPSVVGNYDFGYLKRRLGELFHETPVELKSRISAGLTEGWKAYEDGRVNVHAEIIKDHSIGFDIQEECEGIFRNSQLAMIASRKIRNAVEATYYEFRYCYILRAMHCFHQSAIQSLLYLGMALPKMNHPELDENLLGDLFKLAWEDCCGVCDEEGKMVGEKGCLFILRGEFFERDKEELVKRLGGGEKLFIMSSYQTLGAGQNLQYKAPDRKSLIELVPYEENGDKRHFYKDIDAIYLGDVTNLTANTYSEKRLTISELIDMIAQIEELKENSELSFAEADKMIKLAFKSYVGTGRYENNLLYNTDSVKLQATRQVMQAVGRMCRTYLKSGDIYIFIEEKLLGKLSSGELKKHILPPEMQKIVQLRENLGVEYSNEDVRILRRAEKISSYGMWKIRQILSRDWTEESMELWKTLRQLVLRHPTADKNLWDTEELLQDLYVTSGRKQKRYFYSQYSDFQDVTLDFGTDRIAFCNSGRAKIQAESGTVIAYEMSEAESGLPVMMQYAGLKEYFEEHGYATSFMESDYMMSPVLFHNIYKGALGEIAGRFILREKLGVELAEITDPEKFEFFDYELEPGVYVDFKNWKFSYLQDRDTVKKEILRKLNAIGGKRVYIINVIGDEKAYEGTAPIDARIIEIPCLIDSQGRPISKWIDMIREEDIK